MKRNLMISTAVLALGFTGFVVKNNMFSADQEGLGVHLADFPTGTQVSYQISSNAQALESGELYLDGQDLKLPIPNQESDAGKNITYQLSLNVPADKQLANANKDGTQKEFDNAVNLLLNLNTDTGAIDLKSSGLEEFSDIVVRRGDELQNLTADWSGMYQQNALNVTNQGTDTVVHDSIELAFNNTMSGMDYDPMKGGRVEVFFGDSSGASRTDVRIRYTYALQEVAESLSAVMFMQTKMIGTFFDAKQQLTTQRKWQEMEAEAHKDYHPSEQVCRFGTFIRSVANTEAKADVNKLAMNQILMDRYLAVTNSIAQYGSDKDQLMRSQMFAEHHCDPFGNNGAPRPVCDILDSGGDIDYSSTKEYEFNDKLNKDIDYQRTLLSPLTLDINFADDDLQQLSSSTTAEAALNELSDDERGVVALAYNLYFPRVLKSLTAEQMYTSVVSHYDARSYASKLNVAHSSFVNLIGMKSSAPVGPTTPGTLPSETPERPRLIWVDSDNDGVEDPGEYVSGSADLDEDSGWAYMKAMLREFGVSDSYDTDDTTAAIETFVDSSGTAINDIDRILGVRPSYYAQMEVLTKKIYQTPDFYTNLYDKPENVKRIGVSMDAIELMNQRDRFESLLRREMLTAVLLEEEIQKRANQVNARLYEIMKTPQDQF